MISQERGGAIIPRFVFFTANNRNEAKIIGDIACYNRDSVVLFPCD